MNASLTRDGKYTHLAIFPNFVLSEKERQQHQQPSIIFSRVKLTNLSKPQSVIEVHNITLTCIHNKHPQSAANIHCSSNHYH